MLYDIVYHQAMENITVLDLKEFRDRGYLQEVNRRFFHPLGLACGVIVTECGDVSDLHVIDYRNDPSGLGFSDESIAKPDFKEKSNFIDSEIEKRRDAREKEFGDLIQPIK